MTATGVFSLLLWRWTGDLRLYAWVQFFPCLALPLIFLLFAPRFSGTIYWLLAAILYGLAKPFEFYDSAIYSAGAILSGHTLKHFAAADACGRSRSRMLLATRKSFYYGRNKILVRSVR